MQTNPQTTLETPFGNVRLTVIDGYSVRLDTNSPGVEPLVVHGVPIRVTLNIERQGDAPFAIPTEVISSFIPPREKSGYTYFSRTDTNWAGGKAPKEVSDAAKKKIKETLIPLANEWIMFNGPIMAQAFETAKENRMVRKQTEITELLGQLRKKRDELAEIRRETYQRSKAELELIETLNYDQVRCTKCGTVFSEELEHCPTCE